MQDQTKDSISKKILLLLKDLPGADELTNEIGQAIEQGNFNQASVLINQFLNQLIDDYEDGINGLAKKILENAFDKELDVIFYEKLVVELLRSGVDSWSELFSHFITDDGEFGDSLDKRVNPPEIPPDTSVPDAPPTLIGTSPVDDAFNVAVGSNIVLTFSEAVTAGTGDVIVSNGIDTRIIAVTDSSQVVFNGETVTINPTNDLNPDTTYNIQMASGVILDQEGDAFAGINDSTTLNFATEDTISPTLTGSNPADDAVGIIVGSMIELTFSETVTGGAGEIVIGSGSDTRRIDVTDSSQVIFNGRTVTIDPANDLNPNTSYNIQMASGVILDQEGNAFAGINNPATLNFTTVIITPPRDTMPPTLQLPTFPSDDAVEVAVGSNIVLTFDESVTTGAGEIVIGSGSDTRRIDVTDSSQVTFNGRTVTINPANDLNPDTTYNVQMASGVILDQEGNAFAGINNPATLNFTTVDTIPPRLTGSNPSDDATGISVDSNIQLIFDEPVTVGSGSGSISIVGDFEDFHLIDVTDTSQFTIVDNPSNGIRDSIVTINPVDELFANAGYSVLIPNRLITDLSGNPFAGISDLTTLNFRTSETNIFRLRDDLNENLTVFEGDSANFSVVADRAVSRDTDVVFSVVPGDATAASQGTSNTNLSDFIAGTFNPVTVTIPTGSTTATFAVTGLDDGLTELPETYSVEAVVAGETFMRTINLIDRPSFNLTTGQDRITAGSGNDRILGPLEQLLDDPIEQSADLFGDTLQSFDVIDGGEGLDTLSAIIGAGAGRSESQFGGVYIDPVVSNVEVIEITSLNGNSISEQEGSNVLDMSRISGVTTVNSISSTGALSLNNVSNLIDLRLSNTDSNVTVNYLDDALTSENDVMTLSLNGADGEQRIAINSGVFEPFEARTVEHLMINSLGAANDIVLSGRALSFTETMIVTGNADFNMRSDDAIEFLGNLDASATTGNQTYDLQSGSSITIISGIGDDIIISGIGDDIINSGSGNDVIIGGLGADEMDGGDGKDTFSFGFADSLNTNLDRVINIGVGDVLDFNLDINSDLTFLGSRTSSGITTASLADDIGVAVKSGEAFGNAGDTVVLRLDGNSIAGNDAWYLIQNQHDDSTYDATEDTVIALIGYPPAVPRGFFVTLDNVDGNLQVVQQEIIIL